MHTVHHTEAFVLKKQPSREANMLVWLFTNEFGLVVATVQGIRKQGAKLSMQLSDYSLVSADLVRGRDVWRLVSAIEVKSPFIGKSRNDLGRAYVRTLGAVERFCSGEEANETLFRHMLDCLAAIEHKELEVKSLDTLSLWKVMAALGYIAIEGADADLFSVSLIDAIPLLGEQDRVRLIKETNTVIKESHL